MLGIALLMSLSITMDFSAWFLSPSSLSVCCLLRSFTGEVVAQHCLYQATFVAVTHFALKICCEFVDLLLGQFI